VRDAVVEGLREGTLAAPRFRGRAAGVALVGGGPGDPDLITVRGRRLLAEADVVVADRLAPLALLDELPADVEIVDASKIPYGRSMAQEEINRILVERAKAGKFVVRLKGGDPFVFGRGHEEVVACTEAGVPVTVVPGLSSAVSVPGSPGCRSRTAAWPTSSPSSPGTSRPATRSRWWTGTRWPGCAARWCC
jgi:uroporphyrin-III C-methyltransferase/precorrin-2 dehydrogenase/sirohydrochlorin ferrochelatase